MWPSFVNVNVEFSTHVVKCAVRKYACDVCDFTSQKESNIKRHTKRARTELIESPITLNQKLDDTDEVPDKAKNTRNINNLMSSEGESEKKKKGCHRTQVFYFQQKLRPVVQRVVMMEIRLNKQSMQSDQTVFFFVARNILFFLENVYREQGLN